MTDIKHSEYLDLKGTDAMWKFAPGMPTDRTDFGVTVVDDKVLVTSFTSWLPGESLGTEVLRPWRIVRMYKKLNVSAKCLPFPALTCPNPPSNTLEVSAPTCASQPPTVVDRTRLLPNLPN